MFYQYFYHGKISSHDSHRDFTVTPIFGWVGMVWISTLGDYFFSKPFCLDLVGIIFKFIRYQT